jgi:hypothetical protein
MRLSFIVPGPKASSKIIQIMFIQSNMQKFWQTVYQLPCLKYSLINDSKKVYFGSLQSCLDLFPEIRRILTVTLACRVLYSKY